MKAPEAGTNRSLAFVCVSGARRTCARRAGCGKTAFCSVLSTRLGDGGIGIGKSTFASWLIARATRGQLPGHFHGEPINVLVVGTNEDGVDDTLVPRVKAAAGKHRTAADSRNSLG